MKSRCSFLVVMILALSVFVLAGVPLDKTKPEVGVKNFGRINQNYFRGAQPKGWDYVSLAQLGIKTVIDLQHDGNPTEKGLVEAKGMNFFRIGMWDNRKPTLEQVAEFLKIVNNPANQPVFIHCKGGRHRTGVMTAVYRMTHDGWTVEQAYVEMKQYDFGYGFGHGPLKEFAYEYYARMNYAIVQ